MQINSNYSLPPMNVNPNVYAQQYANENNITLEKAKEELSTKYGAPTAPDESIFTANNISTSSDSSFSLDDLEGLDSDNDSNFSISEFFQAIFGLFRGDSAENQSQDYDPDTIAQQYADENNMTLDEAKAELKAKFGDPQARTTI